MFDKGVLRQFDEIEGKVDKLIEVCKSLGVANSELKTRIEDLERKLSEKVEAEKFYQEQRDQVRQKIDNLLGKLHHLDESGPF
ncbi:MAG: cell division protein ZapB [Thermodesulfobacteriota bacterium]